MSHCRWCMRPKSWRWAFLGDDDRGSILVHVMGLGGVKVRWSRGVRHSYCVGRAMAGGARFIGAGVGDGEVCGLFAPCERARKVGDGG